ncbi:hypothetical protein BBEV_1698 [Salisediminibacterium beveridgei]|uniref:Uncharacterized protein n=1 Tax=Salisediminibacterium beveridgei TaxID=632773 RepID=A0A1D7QVR1_9BACI|nr:hypothetical protein BBEV_1698 [Salisediminibacterium beveridgei]
MQFPLLYQKVNAIAHTLEGFVMRDDSYFSSIITGTTDTRRSGTRRCIFEKLAYLLTTSRSLPRKRARHIFSMYRFDKEKTAQNWAVFSAAAKRRAAIIQTATAKEDGQTTFRIAFIKCGLLSMQ